MVIIGDTAMKVLCDYALCVLMIAGVASAEMKVFTDASFPYRVISPSTWVEKEKNDSLFVLQDMTEGKKTRLKLTRYNIDTSVIKDTTNWSCVNYIVNHDMANRLGNVIWDDTSRSVRIGDLRAFELCAFYTQELGDEVVKWAELCRWTERNNYGYCIELVGDTLDLMNNFLQENSSYMALMDSISIMELAATGTMRPQTQYRMTILRSRGVAEWYDLLGKRTLPPTLGRSALLLRNREKVLLLRKSSVR